MVMQRPAAKVGEDNKAQMSFRLFSRRAAIYSLVLVFGAIPVSVALTNSMMLVSVVFWLLSLDRVNGRDFLKRSWAHPVVRPALALALLVVLASFWSPASWDAMSTGFHRQARSRTWPRKFRYRRPSAMTASATGC